MTIYCTTWRLCCGTIIVLGLGTALLVWSIPGVLVTFVLAAACTGLWRYCLGEQANIGDRPTTGVLCGQAAAGGMTAVSIGGLMAVSGALTLLLAVAAAATSPRAVRWWGSRLRPAGRPALTPALDEAQDLEAVARDVDEVCLRSMSNAELCQAWRRSYTALVQPSSVMHRALIVACRQAYLDEMAQRDPKGFSAWLGSGARAASGPDRFLHCEG